MTSKKQLLADIEQLKQTISNMQNDTEFKTSQIMMLEAQVQQAIARSQILSGSDNEEVVKNACKVSDYNQIVNNQIPQKLAWLYWIWINEHTNYWIGRYNDFTNAPETIDKDELELALRVAILYGRAVYNKKDNKAYWVNYVDKNGKYSLSRADAFISDKNAYVVSNGIYKLDDKYIKESITADKEDCCDLSFQFGNLGIYVWYLIYGCLYLLTSLYICCNASMLINKIFYEVNDLNKFKDEIKYITDPFVNVVPIKKTDLISATASKKGINELAGTENKVLPFKLASTDTNQMEQLITANKYINETLHNLYGIPITSAKNQSLSADANLSASTTKMKMMEHDRRLLDPIKKVLGFEIVPRELDMITPQDLDNENADKDAMGIANTDGDKVARKVEE